MHGLKRVGSVIESVALGEIHGWRPVGLKRGGWAQTRALAGLTDAADVRHDVGCVSIGQSRHAVEPAEAGHE